MKFIDFVLKYLTKQSQNFYQSSPVDISIQLQQFFISIIASKFVSIIPV